MKVGRLGYTQQPVYCFAMPDGASNDYADGYSGPHHIPTLVYLTNQDGDIFYYIASFNNVEIYAVSFKDLNKDGLKDIIIIYGVEEYSSSHLAKIFL